MYLGQWRNFLTNKGRERNRILSQAFHEEKDPDSRIYPYVKWTSTFEGNDHKSFSREAPDGDYFLVVGEMTKNGKTMVVLENVDERGDSKEFLSYEGVPKNVIARNASLGRGAVFSSEYLFRRGVVQRLSQEVKKAMGAKNKWDMEQAQKGKQPLVLTESDRSAISAIASCISSGNFLQSSQSFHDYLQQKDLPFSPQKQEFGKALFEALDPTVEKCPQGFEDIRKAVSPYNVFQRMEMQGHVSRNLFDSYGQIDAYNSSDGKFAGGFAIACSLSSTEYSLDFEQAKKMVCLQKLALGHLNSQENDVLLQFVKKEGESNVNALDGLLTLHQARGGHSSSSPNAVYYFNKMGGKWQIAQERVSGSETLLASKPELSRIKSLVDEADLSPNAEPSRPAIGVPQDTVQGNYSLQIPRKPLPSQKPENSALAEKQGDSSQKIEPPPSSFTAPFEENRQTENRMDGRTEIFQKPTNSFWKKNGLHFANTMKRLAWHVGHVIEPALTEVYEGVIKGEGMLRGFDEGKKSTKIASVPSNLTFTRGILTIPPIAAHSNALSSASPHGNLNEMLRQSLEPHLTQLRYRKNDPFQLEKSQGKWYVRKRDGSFDESKMLSTEQAEVADQLLDRQSFHKGQRRTKDSYNFPVVKPKEPNFFNEQRKGGATPSAQRPAKEYYRANPDKFYSLRASLWKDTKEKVHFRQPTSVSQVNDPPQNRTEDSDRLKRAKAWLEQQQAKDVKGKGKATASEVGR